MGGNNKVANQVKLKPLQQVRAQSARASSSKQIDLMNKNLNESIDEHSDVKGRCRLVFKEQDQKVVELMREDKSREQHRIMK